MKKNIKIASLITVFGLFFISICIPAFGAEISQKNQFGELLEKYKITNEEIIKELEHSKKNATEIYKLTQEILSINELINKNIKNPDLYKKYSARKEKLSNSLYEKYGLTVLATSLHLPNFDIEKDSIKEIEKSIGATIALYKNTSNCFNNNVYADSFACEDFAEKCSGYGYGSDNGDMYYYELSNDLELRKIDVSDNDAHLFSAKYYQGQETVLRNAYYFCRLLSQITNPFTPKEIRRNDDQMDFEFIESFYGSISPYPQEFDQICIKSKPSKERVNRLLNLKNQFPDNWTINVLYDSYSKWQPACNKAAQQICERAYVLKGQIILTYQTMACKNREVTKEDIENDLHSFDSHAAKLKHSILLDEINVCQKAYDNGFRWFYREPTLSEECKKGTEQTPKKKK